MMTDTQTMRAELDRLLTEFGNLQFDCGEWDQESEDCTTPLADIVAKCKVVREAIHEHVQVAVAVPFGYVVRSTVGDDSGRKREIYKQRIFKSEHDAAQCSRQWTNHLLEYHATALTPKTNGCWWDVNMHLVYTHPAPEPVSVPTWQERSWASDTPLDQLDPEDHTKQLLAEVADLRAALAAGQVLKPVSVPDNVVKELPDWSSLKCADVLRELAQFGPVTKANEKMLKGYIDGKLYYDDNDLRELATACAEAADWLERRAALAADRERT